MIEIKNVSVSFGEKKVLDNFSLTLPEHGIFCLRASSGAGKTTLLRVLLGLQRTDFGTVSGLAGKKTAVVFQEDRLLAKSALKNVAVVSNEKEAVRLLTALGFAPEDFNKKPSQLSGGMCRRVALARALAYGGEVLVADEPFKGLDDELKSAAVALIKSAGFSLIIFTTHETDEIEKMGAQTLALT